MKVLVKTGVLAFAILGFAGSLFAQNHAPVVDNVTFTQRTDGSQIVDIFYDVSDEDGDLLTISMQVSNDGGSTWTISCNETSGDIGGGIITATSKRIEWNFGAEHPGLFSDQCVVMIIANDGVSPGIEWCDVPAGEYTFGEGDTIKVIDYDFKIMKYEVTNRQYRAYLEEALSADEIFVDTVGYQGYRVNGYYPGDHNFDPGYQHYFNMIGHQIHWDGHNFYYEPEYADHPVVGVTWFGAWGFSNFYGWRLPNQHEWEKAARGNTGWDYPWGDSIDGSRANYDQSGDPWDDGTTPVGFFNGQNYEGFQTTDSPSPYGVYDMAGNVYNWVNSWGGEGLISYIARGGCWFWPSHSTICWYSFLVGPEAAPSLIGFRSARTP